MFSVFQNEPLVNFTEDNPKQRMQEALTLVVGKLGKSYPVVIGKERVETGHINPSRNPSRMSQLIGNVSDASPELVDRAFESAHSAFPSWSNTPVETRARYLIKAAAIMRRKIYEYSAWLVYEAGKSWPEAYAEAAEAVDFLEFYAREAVRWGQPHPTTQFPGEENEVSYFPLGVGGVIAPWNFPLAILAGMTAAAIAAGNTVLLKPAEQTPVIAAKFMELLDAASLPAGVVNFIPGPGETVGEAMTGHPGITFVAFTGSKDVGLHINQRLATPNPEKKCIPRAILEMGGKDAIVVDENVNPDIAADGIVASAFGFQGQKCSACSRLIAHTKVYDAVLQKVVEKAAKLVVGDPADASTNMGAVIDADSYRKIMSYIAIGRSEGKLVLGGEDSNTSNDGGYFVHPTIFADVAPTSRLAQEEIFGPLLSVIRANSFQEAISIANDTQYGLTGGVYSNSRENLEYARREFQVGNLYLNRKCTGAFVDVQPFGGSKLSGTNSKAGGRQYLGLFLQGKSVCERW